MRPHIACVIPCFNVRDHVLQVIERVGAEVTDIFVIDDCCPQSSGQWVQAHCSDSRVKVLFNPENLGVGGAVMHGYKAAMAAGAEIIVKIDGDNQMDPSLVPDFVAPIMSGEADYVKGNRFFIPEAVTRMPLVRIIGNSCLSFFSKISTGYWSLFDPTNGYTAIHAAVLETLPLRKISNGYFFESDILFRLNCAGAAVVDLPMTAVYGDESSGLRVIKVIPEFLLKHMRNTAKRIFYRYFVRDFSLASVELIVGLATLSFGVIYGSVRWYESAVLGNLATAGAVMLAALPVFVGIQLLLAFLNADMASAPRKAVFPVLMSRRRARAEVAGQ